MSLTTVLVAAALVSSGVFIALAFTAWGRRRPLHRYGALSVAAHLLLFAGLACVKTGGPPLPGSEDGPPVRVQIVMRSPVAAEVEATAEPAERETPPPLEPPAEPEQQPPPDAPELTPDPVPIEPMPIEPTEADPAPTPPDAGDALPNELAATTEPSPPTPPIAAQAKDESPPDTVAAQTLPAQPEADPPTPPQPAEPTPAPAAAQQRAVTPIAPLPRTPAAPASYATRGAMQQRRLSADQGGTQETLDAVAVAVDWLARAQREDGAWDAARWGAGRETMVFNENREGAGGRAETGLTGLALLAMGGAGHTHLAGPYRDRVTRGLQFLLNQQARDGALYGQAKRFARMYCHSMATFALAEAMAVTRDERLRPAVEAAVDYLEKAQSRATGGWRYFPGDRGDTSQMGWAVMALRSAELAGVPVRESVWRGCEKFVGSVARGREGGLAVYKPGDGVSRPMTAEALYCRQILGVTRPRGRADAEAVGFVLDDLPSRPMPGASRAATNLYYWYYATLALHHHSTAGPEGAAAWRRWNAAMQSALLARQVGVGPNQGSWNPDTLWGSYGGRVYSTALATMCLEVYYRYDPETIGRDPWLAAREAPLRR